MLEREEGVMGKPRTKRIEAVRVGGENAKVVWNDTLYRDHDALGMVNHDTKIIYLDSGLRENKMRAFKVLIHEVLHLIEGFMREDLDELTLDRFAQAIAVMLVESELVDLEGIEIGPEKSV